MPHIHEKIDFTTEVFIIHKNTVLLRRHDKYKIWLSVGGHVELNEDPNQAAVREVKEEVGLSISLWDKDKNARAFPGGTINLIPPAFLNRHRINEMHEHITFVYFAKTDENRIRQGDKEISEDIHWFTKEELDAPQYEIRDNVKFYAHTALKELGAASSS